MLRGILNRFRIKNENIIVGNEKKFPHSLWSITGVGNIQPADQIRPVNDKPLARDVIFI